MALFLLVLWPPDQNSQLTGKDPDAGKDRKQKEKRVAKEKMVGWHHQFNAHEPGQTPSDSKGQGGLECCSPWGCKESDTTCQLNDNNLVQTGSQTRALMSALL